MKILQVTSKIIDVFYHDGWENWVRFEVVRGKYFRKLGGGTVPNGIMQELRGLYLKG